MDPVGFLYNDNSAFPDLRIAHHPEKQKYQIVQSCRNTQAREYNWAGE